MDGEWTDEGIIVAIQAGKLALFEKLVQKYQAKITQLATYFIKEPHEAKDICQETFLKAYQGLHLFRAESSFYTWLYRIAVNTAKNHIKSQEYRLLRCHRLLDTLHEPLEITAQEASPEANLVRDEVAQNFETTLKGMPKDLQLSLIFREMHGLSYDEIADIMHCPVGTVRSRIHRARCYFEEMRSSGAEEGLNQQSKLM